MKRIFLVMFLVLTVSSVFALEADFSATYMSRYVFRGERLLDNAYVAPKFMLKTDNIEVSAMTIYDAKKEESYRNVYELVFKTQVNKIKLDVGFVQYDPRKGESTNEFFAKTMWAGSWQPSLTVFFDVKEGSGKYIQAGFAKNIFKGTNNVVFGTNIGYVINNEYMGVKNNGDTFSGLYDAELYLKSSIKMNKHLTLEPVIAYSMPLSNDGKEAIRSLSVDKASKNLYGGVTLHASF